MIAAELIIGAVGAGVSLGSGLIQFVQRRKSKKSPVAEVTIRMGETTLRKEGTLEIKDVPKILDFVGNRPTEAPKTSAH
jgi:hypothetical protein